MSDHGIVLLRQNKWSQKQLTSARTCFQNEIMPILIPLAMNSLQDKKICQALYRASQAEIKVLLNVRGICCGQYSVELVKLQELIKNQDLKVVIDNLVKRWKLNPMDLKSRSS
jgi:polyphosphate kinase